MKSLLSINTEAQWHSVQQQASLLLVEFGAPSCAPCRALLPLLENMNVDLGDQVQFSSLNIEQLPDLAQRLGIQTLPTLVLWRQQQELSRLTGLKTETQLRQWLAPFIEVQYERLLRAAKAYQESGQWHDALVLLRTAVADAPHRPLVQSALLNTLFDAHRDGLDVWDELQQRMDELPFEVRRDSHISQLASRMLLWGQSEALWKQWHSQARQGDTTAKVALACVPARQGDYDSSLEQLLTWLKSEDAPLAQQARAALIELLNTMPDRQAANTWRRRLFALDQAEL